MTRVASLGLSVVLLLGACGAGSTRLVVAAGTTVVDSGLMDRLAAAYEAAHPGVEISIVGQPTQLALELGRNGSVDITVTHAPLQEKEMIDDGVVAKAAPVFGSRFVLAGPEALDGVFTGYELPEVLREVFAFGLIFVSRGDGSGTYDKEWENWIEAGLDPRRENWYLETGQGMGPTLLVADQRGALVLVEIGSWLAARESVTLVDMELDPGALDNPYVAMVMAASSHPDDAKDFVDWLASPDGVVAIEKANRELFGAVVYSPVGES